MWFQFNENGLQVELRRTLFGGLRRRPTEQLLRQIANDYAALDLENRELKDALARLRAGRDGAASRSAGEPGPVDIDVRPVDSLREPDELAAVLLDVVQRVARELGETVQRDSGAIVERLRTDVLELERDVLDARTSLRKTIGELDAWRSGLGERSEQGLKRAGGKRKKPGS